MNFAGTGARAVILAAGRSERMGSQKLLMTYRGRKMIDYAIEAAREWQPVIVAGAEVAAALRETGAALIVNEAPERGMVHSLALADAEIPKETALVVLLGDKPLVTPALIRRVCAALGNADVAYPVHANSLQPGHPVVFSSKARRKIATLEDGDRLHELRDDPALARVTVPTEDPGAFFDVDTPPMLER